MTITVTKEDFDAAMAVRFVYDKPRAMKCPVAMAMIRQGIKNPSVGRTSTYYENGKVYFHSKSIGEFTLPWDAGNEERAWDQLPYSFDIREEV